MRSRVGVTRCRSNRRGGHQVSDNVIETSLIKERLIVVGPCPHVVDVPGHDIRAIQVVKVPIRPGDIDREELGVPIEKALAPCVIIKQIVQASPCHVGWAEAWRL